MISLVTYNVEMKFSLAGKVIYQFFFSGAPQLSKASFLARTELELIGDILKTVITKRDKAPLICCISPSGSEILCARMRFHGRYLGLGSNW